MCSRVVSVAPAVIQRIRYVQLRVDDGSSNTSYCEGAVVAAASAAAEIINEAASAIRNITWDLLRDSNDISADSVCAAVC